MLDYFKVNIISVINFCKSHIILYQNIINIKLYYFIDLNYVIIILTFFGINNNNIIIIKYCLLVIMVMWRILRVDSH